MRLSMLFKVYVILLARAPRKQLGRSSLAKV
jgi:hypothetical protein